MKSIALLAIFLSINQLNTASVTPPNNRSPRIVGGTDADILEFPFLVGFIWNSFTLCGGTLLSEFWILTAAHCSFPLNEFWIEYGTTELTRSPDAVRRADPELFIQHELFNNPSRGANDVGLVKIKKAIVTGFENPFVRLAPPGAFYSTGTPASVAGWGVWSPDPEGNATFTPLQKVGQKIWDFDDCKLIYKEQLEGSERQILPSNICAGVPDFSRSACLSDSGGPLLVNGIQVGIVSWGPTRPCIKKGVPSVYVFMPMYFDWIVEKTGINYKMQSFMVENRRFEE